jgi:uncharacterized protein YceK
MKRTATERERTLMNIVRTASTILTTTAVLLFASGCATVQTMAHTELGSPKVYSGTRLNISAIRHDASGVDRFKVEPPQHPLIDLPFSFVLDTVLLFPVTLPAAAYEAVFR